MNKNHIWLFVMVVAALTGLAVWQYAIQTPPIAVFAQVTGTITYRERIALPPGASAEISLADISLADAPASIISSKTLDNPGQVPISFSLDYDPASIDERFRYAVQARITIDGQLAFVNETVHPVITHGAGAEAHLILSRVQGDSSFPVNTEAAARQIDARRDDLVPMNGTLLTGDASITYSAYRDHESGNEIVLIVEKRQMGIFGNAVVAIYYSGGRPFRYAETGQRRNSSESQESGLDNVTVRFDFDEESNVINRSKTVNGFTVEPDDSEITGAYDHARFLIEESRLLTEINSSSQIAEFACQGNEPFWDAIINGDSMNLRRFGNAEKSFLGQHTPLPNFEGDRFEWVSNTMTSNIPDIAISVTREECQDSMSDETPPFAYSAIVRYAHGETVRGCCRSQTP